MSRTDATLMLLLLGAGALTLLLVCTAAVAVVDALDAAAGARRPVRRRRPVLR